MPKNTLWQKHPVAGLESRMSGVARTSEASCLRAQLLVQTSFQQVHVLGTTPIERKRKGGFVEKGALKWGRKAHSAICRERGNRALVIVL